MIAGTDVIIDRTLEALHIVEQINGINLAFSSQPIDECDVMLKWDRRELSDVGGDWYYCSRFDLYGWLCPSLRLYFQTPPSHLYIKVL